MESRLLNALQAAQEAERDHINGELENMHEDAQECVHGISMRPHMMDAEHAGQLLVADASQRHGNVSSPQRNARMHSRACMKSVRIMVARSDGERSSRIALGTRDEPTSFGPT